MDWIQNIQIALNFIEKQLHDKQLTPELVAEQVHFSSVHFSRVFHILTGITVSEYIRNRRLSIAGEQLKFHNRTVIDVALDLGYESPEAFAKAFKRFHGVNPRESKKAILKEFYPLEMKLMLSQEKPIEWQVEEKEGFYLNGSGKWVSGDDDVETANIWKSSELSGYIDRCYGFNGFEALVGIYSHKGYSIKAKCSLSIGEESIYLLPHQWVIFKCHGDMPEAINRTWNKIYSQWMPKTSVVISEMLQLEIYKETDDGYACEIWIGIDG